MVPAHLTTLNEGREVNPDDTPHPFDAAVHDVARSTKVGRLIPTTPFPIVRGHRRRLPLNEGREVNPDDTRVPREARGFGMRRSTKVGRLIPTTPALPLPLPSACSSLNEGREVNPDDTAGLRRGCPARRGALNEGREVNPDDTGQGAAGRISGAARSTKVGRLIPTTRGAVVGMTVRSAIAQRRSGG